MKKLLGKIERIWGGVLTTIGICPDCGSDTISSASSDKCVNCEYYIIH